nr:MAG: ORF1 [TTV-like mini virus]UGV37301.1 MAG: ORF1 [TTV-like mini virus]
MPPFYRRPFRPYRTWWRRRRRQPFRRRLRQTFRRRIQRRRTVRRFKRYTRFKKKLPKITLKQWQPKTIHKCKIKGDLCLLTCGKGRTNHNYTLTAESYVPTKEPGGGAWSIMQLTLRALYDELLHFRNWWTKSNNGLPLVRFIGGKFTFYRSSQTDYIVTITSCPPFEVTQETYFNTQPIRHLMNRHKVIVPRLDRPWTKRAYIKRRFKLPSTYSNKWYFQSDLYNTPLVMLTTSACSLDQPYAPDNEISTNITLTSLNTDFFQNPQWGNIPEKGYRPKYTGTTDTYLYAAHNGTETSKLTYKDVIPLFQTKLMLKGKKLPNSWGEAQTNGNIKQEYWGNPFHPDYNSYRFVYGKYPTENTYNSQNTFTDLHELYFTCRYNPFKDKGQGNKVYMKSTSLQQGSFMTLPTDTRLIAQDLPLWLIFWGYEDWLLKSKPIQHIQEDYQVVIQTDYLYPKRLNYVLLDDYFTSPHEMPPTETDRANWHPKLEMQEEQLEQISQTGPFTPKINHTKNIQIHCFYNLAFKWGGCPAPMEIITDPANQEKFPIPNYINQTIEIQDPTTPPQHQLWEWDERHQMLTATAAKRIKSHIETPTFFTDFGAKDPSAKTQETPPTPTTEETETPQEQIELLQQHQRELKHRIKQLIKRQKYYPIQ